MKAIEQIIEHVSETGEVPAPIGDIVEGGKIDIPEETGTPSIEDQLAAVGGESVDVLLSKEANKEQLEIARRIERYNAVLVQGPPGTCKTHTIANLMGHFLAQGKSVLVTSQTQKALSVLKEKVTPGLQNLCVSVLDDSNVDMEKSIDGITSYMAQTKALESLNPSTNKFDIVIIDEASQSDISSLAILYMGKKLVIVGDDKQVSPMAVGIQTEKMNALKEMYIEGKIPNAHLYDAKTSIYDIAATTFQPLMLHEHFRCVPEIIKFSNWLSYDFKIKPLRDCSNITGGHDLSVHGQNLLLNVLTDAGLVLLQALRFKLALADPGNRHIHFPNACAQNLAAVAVAAVVRLLVLVVVLAVTQLLIQLCLQAILHELGNGLLEQILDVIHAAEVCHLQQLADFLSTGIDPF